MNDTQARQFQARFARMAANYRFCRGFLPPSIEESDLVQEALCEALECEGRFRPDGRAKFSTYLAKPVLGRWANLIARSHYGPSAAVRSWRRKRGGWEVDYGEVSLEIVASDGTDWFASQPSDENSESEVSYFKLTMAEAVDCLIDIRRQVKNQTDVGISWVKTRNKYHACVTVCGRQQFVGQFKQLADARAAKAAFLESFMDAVLAAVEEPNV